MKCPLFWGGVGWAYLPEAGLVFYPESAVERATKVQEAILRAMAKKIT